MAPGVFNTTMKQLAGDLKGLRQRLGILKTYGPQAIKNLKTRGTTGLAGQGMKRRLGQVATVSTPGKIVAGAALAGAGAYAMYKKRKADRAK